jgi:hypothetical protein
MNNSATVVTRLSGKLKPWPVNHAGRNEPFAGTIFAAKIAVYITTRNSQIMMLAGRPMAADVQSANR